MGFVRLEDLDTDSKAILDREFENIYNKYKKLVYYVIVKIIQIPSIAEELSNDAFLILFQHIDTIKIKVRSKVILLLQPKD